MSASDFFKYARGYALHQSGELDVGKLSPSTESERKAASVTRDALQLAKAIGTPLSMGQYRELHDSVEAIHEKYLSRTITEADYQRLLWELPDQFRTKIRQGAGPQQPHYKPSRDQSGQPTNRPAPIPAPSTQGITPPIGDMPELNFKDVWAEVLSMAGVKDSPGPQQGPATQPQTHGRPVSSSEPPPAQTRRGGFLDSIQAGLDAVGVVEPTPFADSANAGISALRALLDPKNAGTHLKNAGISLISAAVPYIGDAAKLAKYDKGGLRGASGGGGKGGDIADRLLGSFGGGGSGGQGAGVGGLLSGATESVSGLAKVMGPAGFAIAGATLGLMKMVEWIGKVDESSKKLVENNRELAMYNGMLAGSYATLDHERLQRTIDRSEAMAGPMSRATEARSNFEQAKQDLIQPFELIKTEIATQFLNLGTLILQGIDYLEHFDWLIEQFYGKSEDEKSAKNVLEFMTQQANERMAKRRFK